MERIQSDCLIIGGGVAGLAIAQSLVKQYKNVFLIEKNNSLGQEISSRNCRRIGLAEFHWDLAPSCGIRSVAPEALCGCI